MTVDGRCHRNECLKAADCRWLEQPRMKRLFADFISCSLWGTTISWLNADCILSDTAEEEWRYAGWAADLALKTSVAALNLIRSCTVASSAILSSWQFSDSGPRQCDRNRMADFALLVTCQVTDSPHCVMALLLTDCVVTSVPNDTCLSPCCCCCSLGQGSSLLWTHTLRPFVTGPLR